VPFEPCVTSNNYFGDYAGLVPLEEGLTFYATWADSRQGCTDTGRFTAPHQHTVGTWFD
jgi:hypothetical protein